MQKSGDDTYANIFDDDFGWMMHKTFLDSLFVGKDVIMMGTLAQSMCALIFWHHTGDSIYFYFLGSALLFGIGRFVQMSSYESRRKHLMSEQSSRAEIRFWYVFYMCGSAITSLWLGIIAAYSVYVYNDNWVSFLALALVMGTMVAAVGRNYGSNLNVTLIVACSFIPFVLAFLATNFEAGTYIIGIGGFLLLGIWSAAARRMANAVHQKFAETQRLRHVSEVLQRQFHDAVSNMPTGLILITKDRKIKYLNDNILKMFGIPKNIRLIDRSLDKLFDVAAKLRLYSESQCNTFKAQIDNIFKGNSQSEILEFSDDFKVEFSVRAESPLDTDNTTGKATDATGRNLNGFVVLCEDVTQRLNNEEKVLYSANYDKLSDIPNRRHLADLINKTVNTRTKSDHIALCVFDIDKFKTINDTFGHASGDEVISRVAQSMKAIKRMYPEIIISRLGGDEFVIAYPGLAKSYDVTNFFDEAFSIICKGYEIHKHLIDVNCSGGVYVCPMSEFELSNAMRKADLALYKVKEMKKHNNSLSVRWALFDTELEQAYRNNQQMSHDLLSAVDNGEITVRYQPMFTSDGSKLVACEALCRWEHPQLGVVSPENFIALAESMNIIKSITKLMLETACKDCAEWDDHTSVSVNLSVLDLARYDIIDVISGALRMANLPANRLQIEITESILLKDGDTAKVILQALNTMGVKTSIDDFGTGYSNLSAIGNLPVSRVKIDRSFIKNITRDEKALKFFEGAVSMITTIGLDVTVEGVETLEQLQLIKHCNVSLLQGYYFGKPVPNAEIKKLITAKASGRTGNVVSISNRKGIA